MRRKNRSRSKIDQLPPDLKNTVDEMVRAVSKFTYAEIQDYLAGKGVNISTSAISTYARHLLANLEAIRIAQENFKALVAEAQKCPEIEYTEIINRIAAQRMLNAVVSKPEDEWNEVKLENLLKEINGMTKAVAYKQRIDVQNKGDVKAAADELKAQFFNVLGTDHPELYGQLLQVLEKQQEAQ